ncbi:MAG: prolyl oligopeptidase family serine peptidase [Bacteroidales bacterium]|nr:prolyl oligopeptidase family serine peptidase [Bacteroidales bacterium]
MKKEILTLMALSLMLTAQADTIPVQQYRYAGPFALRQPVQIDSTDVNAKKYDEKALLDAALNLDLVKQGQPFEGDSLPGADRAALHLLAFEVSNADYFKGELNFKQKPNQYKLYIDGKSAQAGELTLLPGSHTCVLKYLSQPDRADSLQLQLVADSAAQVQASRLRLGDVQEQNQLLDIDDMLMVKRYSAVDISADGKWIIVCESLKRNDWTDHDFYLVERQSGRRIKLTQNSHWLPRTSRFYQIRHVGDKSLMVVIDPATLQEEVWVEDLPCDYFTVFPTEDRLLCTERQDGPMEENAEAFAFVHPDDRQPGWRDRSYLSVYDIRTGLQQQLTYGYHSQWACDIRPDGRRILVAKSESRLTARPTSLRSIYEIDLDSLTVDTLVCRDGFVNEASYSPDGKEIIITGSPECLGGIGNVVPEGMTPSMVDVQLYVMRLSDHSVRPLTKDFDGMVSNVLWSSVNGQIYMTAERGDSCSIFAVDPKGGKITQVAQPAEVVGRFALAHNVPVMAYAGESNDHSWQLYTLEVGKRAKPAQVLHDLNAEIYENIELSPAHAWSCPNGAGDEVPCRYYLPNDFDPSAQYPMIVYYYGGCSGTLRNLEYPYPWTIWAAQGYAVLVVNPSGATGYGQEWAARHVNTAGVDPARDIIAATTTFCDQHEWVRRDRLGCIGASYGGFMTQYLQTVTDIFRCAVSHAGISDHTTYWGYGYWGYTYSEVSMANTYPWTRKDLYVDRSPLYNVDKIKSSMLFLHGTEDTNVPYNNSVQMYTALRLLGRDVAMVSIKGENHGISKPSRRRLWHNATMAWFARCLKDDPTWWDALYPKRTLE